MSVAELPKTEEPTPTRPHDGILLLDSLEIKNFRAFRHLTIEKLGRVNLITGKNNVGKSSLLESLRLYANGGSPQVIRQLLESRNEFRMKVQDVGIHEYSGREARQKDDELSFVNLKYLFFGRNEISTGQSALSISSLGNSQKLVISVGWFRFIEREEENVGETLLRRTLVPVNQDEEFDREQSALYLTTKMGDEAEERFRSDRIFSRINPIRTSGSPPRIPSPYVPPEGLDSDSVGILWDTIVATAEENEVITALRLMIPELERIVFVSGGEGYRSSERMALAKISDVERIPLRSLGDGVNRLFIIALSLVNARNGLLLLNEVENGIHYSVLPNIWRLIFETARRLNVQVFATTHSWDCIEAFAQVAAEDDDPESGKLIQLRNKNGNVIATIEDEDDLKIVVRSGIEVR